MDMDMGHDRFAGLKLFVGWSWKEWGPVPLMDVLPVGKMGSSTWALAHNTAPSGGEFQGL